MDCFTCSHHLTTIKQFNKQEKKNKSGNNDIINNLQKIEKQFGLIDFIMVFVLRNPPSISNFPKALVIYLKTKPKIISLRLEKEEFEILEKRLLKTIKII